MDSATVSIDREIGRIYHISDETTSLSFVRFVLELFFSIRVSILFLAKCELIGARLLSTSVT